MIGVFCFEATWRGWAPGDRERELGALRKLGVDAIVTETVEPPTELIRAGSEAGLRTFVSIACFSAHAWPQLIEGLDLQPVQADGQPRRQMEWYTGLIPTHEAWNAAQLERIARIAEARPAGVILDFIRWPLHWELELRAALRSRRSRASIDGRSGHSAPGCKGVGSTTWQAWTLPRSPGHCENFGPSSSVT